MTTPHLTLEVLSGPLDGQIITLESETDWGAAGTGALSFPWDSALGAPQARLLRAGEQWHIRGYAATRRTHHLRQGEDTIVTHQPVPLAAGDILVASATWLRVGTE
jgi:hypothetical protein